MVQCSASQACRAIHRTPKIPLAPPRHPAPQKSNRIFFFSFSWSQRIAAAGGCILSDLAYGRLGPGLARSFGVSAVEYEAIGEAGRIAGRAQCWVSSTGDGRRVLCAVT